MARNRTRRTAPGDAVARRCNRRWGACRCGRVCFPGYETFLSWAAATAALNLARRATGANARGGKQPCLGSRPQRVFGSAHRGRRSPAPAGRSCYCYSVPVRLAHVQIRLPSPPRESRPRRFVWIYGDRPAQLHRLRASRTCECRAGHRTRGASNRCNAEPWRRGSVPASSARRRGDCGGRGRRPAPSPRLEGGAGRALSVGGAALHRPWHSGRCARITGLSSRKPSVSVPIRCRCECAWRRYTRVLTRGKRRSCFSVGRRQVSLSGNRLCLRNAPGRPVASSRLFAACSGLAVGRRRNPGPAKPLPSAAPLRRGEESMPLDAGTPRPPGGASAMVHARR